jgi:GNAT superfamily N-acetyltransferase
MDAVIDVVGLDELPTIVDLYNQIFRPARDIDSFRRRYLGRYNVLQMLATVQGKSVGFFLGFELKPDTFFAWFYGVHPEFRRHRIATQLMEAAHDWARTHSYDLMRVECHNHHRPLLHLLIALGYDVVGIRWDSDRADNLIIFEKALNG